MFANIANINFELVALLIISVVVVRLVKIHYVSHVLSGIKFFVPQYFEVPRGTKENAQDEEISLEEAISKLNFTMTSIDNSPKSLLILSSQSCFKLWGALIQLFIIAGVAFAFSKVWHCGFPEAGYTVFIPAVLVVGVTSCLNTLLVTSDAELLVPFSMMSFLIFLGLAYLAPHMLIKAETLDGLAGFIRGLLMQISAHLPPMSHGALHLACRVCLCIVLSVTAGACATPARRWAQLLVKMTTGRSFERASQQWLIMLWINFGLPLPLALLHTSLAERAVLMATGGCTSTSGAEVCTSYISDPAFTLSTLRHAGLVVYMVVQCVVYRKHIQSFLDYSVETLTLAMVSKDVVMVKKYKTIIQERTRHLMVVATQFLTIPALLSFLLMMSSRSIPHSSGLCYATRSLLHMSTAPLDHAVQLAHVHNSTHLAQQLAGSPYLDQAFSYSVVGSLSKLTSSMGSASSTIAEPTPLAMGLGDFFGRILGQIYYPPVIVLQDLLQTSVYW
eukprot:gene38152-46361_t